jgi:hypothetical protein
MMDYLHSSVPTTKIIEHLEEIPIYYTGIGARAAPTWALEMMYDISSVFARSNLVLRSGGAKGSDTAFEEGCRSVLGKAEIYLPEEGFRGRYTIEMEINPHVLIFPSPLTSARRIAKEHHPAWDCCKPSVRNLHARNVHQVLGQNPDHPILSSGIVCWTPDGSLDGRGPRCGGTGQALRVAAVYGVPVTNLARPDHREMAERWLAENSIERSAR